jgi:hypothetical protein
VEGARDMPEILGSPFHKLDNRNGAVFEKKTGEDR